VDPYCYAHKTTCCTAQKSWNAIYSSLKNYRDNNAPDLVAAIRDGVKELLKRKRSGRSDLFTYRCPRTGQQVQGWAAADLGDGETYEPETCTACGRVHLVNPKSGEVLESAEK
jgi:hypothetical protein